MKGGMKMDNKMCMMGGCMRCRSGMKIILGLLVLANAYWNFTNWAYFIGGILVIAGILKMIKPCCPHCENCK